MQAELEPLSRRYDVVVANPPYMGSKNMNKWLGDWVKKHYKDVKGDLFSCFMAHNVGMGTEHAQLGFMTPYVWMFIGTYEKLRKFVIQQNTITSLIQLEYSGFSGATVPICTFTLQKGYCPGYRGGYVRLSDFAGADQQAPRALEALANPDCGWFYRCPAANYTEIDGFPIAYWLSPGYRRLLSKGERMQKRFEIGSGLSTSDNERFLRYVWEVSSSKIFSGERSDAKWFLFQKGGSYRKWYGNLEYVVDWENDGERIKYWVTHNPKDPNTKVWSRRIFNTHLYFKEGITWSLISSDEISFRYLPSTSMISNAAGGVFKFKDRTELLAVLGALNSSVHTGAFKMINPTINFSSGVIQRSPLCEISLDVSSIAEENIHIAATDWDSEETSFNFKRNPLL